MARLARNELSLSVTTQCCYKKALENFTTTQIEKVSNNFLLISYGQVLLDFIIFSGNVNYFNDFLLVAMCYCVILSLFP